MTARRTFVVVGAGLAGAKAAEELRTRGFDGRLVLVGDEPHPPYERPALSKDFLLGKADAQSTRVHDDGYYADHDIDLRTGVAVTTLDRRDRVVTLATGERLSYDALLLTTGSAPRRLPLPGADLAGVHYLRTLDDARLLRGALDGAGGRRVVVVGGGWIGCEVAAAARTLGHETTLLFPEDAPLARVLGDDVGASYADLHRGHGVDVRPRTGVTGFTGTADVQTVVTTSGEELPADLVVIGAGAAPRTTLAEAAGLAVGDGVEVDERLRTADPAVFAAGDVAAAWHPVFGRRLRVEHWANALNQGAAAGRAMLGDPSPYDRLPYFYSDQFDRGMEYVGHGADADRVVLRGDVPGGQFCAYWLRDGRVVAALNANVWDVVETHKRLITSGVAVDPAALSDTGTPLEDLVPHDSDGNGS